MTYPFSSSSETTAAGERDPGGMQRGERERLVAGLAHVLKQLLLLSVSGRHRPIVAPLAPSEIMGRVERF